MAHDVFISYSTSDKPTADAVCAGLESRGVRCWIAPRDVLPSTDWGTAIIDAISHSQLMVLVYSSNTNGSQQVKRELERAVSKGVPILPFRIEDVPVSQSLEWYLSLPHWLDAFTPPLEQHINYLAGTVRVLLDRAAEALTDAGAQLPASAPVEVAPLSPAALPAVPVDHPFGQAGNPSPAVILDAPPARPDQDRSSAAPMR
jgi:TIR domain